jgi:GNAT superfamily N-acetyltransferase
MAAIEVRLLDAADAPLAGRLAGLINAVYAGAEQGLWRNGATRTTRSEVAALVDAREIGVATLGGRLAGAVRVRALSDDTGEFGMLAADPGCRGIGVGRQLVAFAERHARDRGLAAMQLELLVPRAWRHPSKVFLDDWYRRIGYRVTRTTNVGEVQPDLSPLLATPCAFVIYLKALAGAPGQAARVPSANVSTCSDSSKRSSDCSHVKPGQRYSARPSAGW